MAFENVYLTKEEKEEFKAREIYGTNRTMMGRTKLGQGNFVRCTIDRERKIYLFFCGRGPYDFEEPPKDHYFALVWDAVTGNSCVSFRVYFKFGSESVSGKGSDLVWYNMSIEIPKGLEDKKELFIEMFKEAMCVYGIDGNPNFDCHFIVKFDF